MGLLELSPPGAGRPCPLSASVLLSLPFYPLLFLCLWVCLPLGSSSPSPPSNEGFLPSCTLLSASPRPCCFRSLFLSPFPISPSAVSRFPRPPLSLLGPEHLSDPVSSFWPLSPISLFEPDGASALPLLPSASLFLPSTSLSLLLPLSLPLCLHWMSPLWHPLFLAVLLHPTWLVISRRLAPFLHLLPISPPPSFSPTCSLSHLLLFAHQARPQARVSGPREASQRLCHNSGTRPAIISLSRNGVPITR